MSKVLILICIVFGLQNDWLNKTKKLISATDENAVLINSKVLNEKEGTSIITEYKAGANKKIKVKFTHTKLMDAELNFYENDGFILGRLISGKNALLYKRKRLENEPYATLIDSKTYFKTETEGINFAREINIYETDNIEDVRKKLNKLEFETKHLNGEDYTRLKEEFDRIAPNKK